jgi:hypothetical protein
VDWKKAETYKGNGEIVEGKVDGSNSGGVLVRFHSLQGFLPYSQMSPSLLLKGTPFTYILFLGNLHSFSDFTFILFLK